MVAAPWRKEELRFSEARLIEAHSWTGRNAASWLGRVVVIKFQRLQGGP